MCVCVCLCEIVAGPQAMQCDREQNSRVGKYTAHRMSDDYRMRMRERSRDACGVVLCARSALLIDPGARDVVRPQRSPTGVRVRRLPLSV